MSSAGDERSPDGGHSDSEPTVARGSDDNDGERPVPLQWYRRFMDAETGPLMIVREMLSSAAMVAAVGLLLFAISGVWPPMVAVESGSMQPHMQRGDLVFIMDEARMTPDAAHADTGVVPHRTGTEVDYRTFGDYGDVIIYKPDGGTGTPIIHRARFWVDEGENWYDRADPAYVHSSSCEETPNCPAPHAGFVTKGDANAFYDQVSGISGPVRPSWITGTAEVKVPWLGWIRLQFATLSTNPVGPAISPVGGGPGVAA